MNPDQGTENAGFGRRQPVCRSHLSGIPAFYRAFWAKTHPAEPLGNKARLMRSNKKFLSAELGERTLVPPWAYPPPQPLQQPLAIFSRSCQTP